MFIDLTFEVSPAASQKMSVHDRAAFGHLGTHFDLANKQFKLENIERPGVVFDVSGITDRDIDLQDIDISIVESSMFVAFYTGFIEKVEYGTDQYFSTHPQLSNNLIDRLTERQISIIGVDFAGIRRAEEHGPIDQYCADRGVFIVENLCNLKTLLGDEDHRLFTAHTYPIKFADMTGLPCRVVGEI